MTTTNRAPQVTSPGNQSSAAGDVVSLPIVASDTDQDALTYTATGLPPGLGIDPGSGVISGTVANNAYSGSPYSVSVQVSDGALSGSQTFTWSINRVGVVNPADQSNINGDAVSLQLQASDGAGGALSFSATTPLPAGLTIIGSGLISGTLTNTADAGSPYTVTVRATTWT